MFEIRPHADGVVISVRVQPGARRTGLVGLHGSAVKVAVSAPPEDGKANTAVVELLADLLGLRRSAVKLVSGASARDKKFLLSGADLDTVRSTVERLLAESA